MNKEVHSNIMAAGRETVGLERLSAPTIEELCEVFWHVESRYDLLAWTIEDVHPWPLLRMQLYYAATQRAGLFGAPHPSLKQHLRQVSWVEKRLNETSTRMRIWAQSLRTGWPFRSSSVAAGSKRYAIVTSGRRLDGSDPYTDAVRAEAGRRALIIEQRHAGGKLPGSYDISSLKRLEHRRVVVNKADRMLANDVRDAFVRELGIEPGDILKMAMRKVLPFRAMRTGSKSLFEAHGTETLFLTNAYGVTNQALVAGAREAGATIVELQHGLISRFHLGYSWPSRPKVPYAPDSLWCFGDYWSETTPLSSGVVTRTIGAPYVRSLVRSDAGQRRSDLVVFTSQGVVGRHLFDLCLAAARRRPDRQFVFRLHPNESLETYEAMVAAQSDVPANFSLSHRNPNIFTLLAQAEVQVGAFSTTLFEGMALGTRTVVVDLPGVEYMRPAIARGDAIFVRDVEELVARLDEAPVAANPEVYYAEPVSPLL